MKKIFAVFAAAVLAVSVLAGCGSSKAETTAAAAPAAETTAAAAAAAPVAETTAAAAAAAPAAAEISTVKAGTLTVATSPDFAPYEFYAIGADGTPSMAGFDIALAGYIADYLGLQLEIIPVDFDGVLTELGTKSVDLGMAGLSPDPDRESIMDFSDLYYKGGQSLVCIKENADKIKSFDDINSKEFTVGAQTGSIQLDLANENTPNANIVSMPKVTDIISELIAGKEFAAFIETDVAKCYQKNYPELEIVMDVPYDQEGSAVGVSKGNEALLKGVNEAIAAAIADGSMNQFIADANELATGEKYEGLLDENSKVPQN